MRTYKHIIVFLISSLIIFTSCKKEDNPTTTEGNELVGTWVLTKIILTSLGNTELTPEQAKLSGTIVAKSDRTFTSTQTENGITTNDSGTWSVSGKKLTLTGTSGVPVEYDFFITGNKLQVSTTRDISPFGVVPITLEFTKQ